MSDEVNQSRRRFLTVATSAIGGAGLAMAAMPFIVSWFPSAKAQALGAPVEIDISKLEPGGQLTVPWRGKPIWIVRRTDSVLKSLSEMEPLLRDPQSVESIQPSYALNEARSIKPEFLILVGVCTHLGCVPTYRPDKGGIDADWPGGFYCPCHGSKYDLAGRVYKGMPAPLNLVVPPHQYLKDTVVLIGVDQGVA
jgi:ubiquinol-cytochrome c reductase iron-sulfur subunit